MKRQRTSSTKAVHRAPTVVTADGSANRHLSAAERKEVKRIIDGKLARSICHNGPTAIAPVTGVLASAPTVIVAFTATNQGLGEDKRRGDQIYIDKIHFKAYLVTTAADDVVRLTVMRQAKSGFPPQPINPAVVWQNFGTAEAGILSTFQDDQPCTVLYDKRFLISTASGGKPYTVAEFTLDFSKRPLPCVYQDGTVTGTPFNTVIGDIELIAATRSAGLVTMTYVYDMTFHEK